MPALWIHGERDYRRCYTIARSATSLRHGVTCGNDSMKRQTREGLEAELRCWRGKLEELLARQVGTPVELAIRQLQVREIIEHITEITAKLEN